MSMDTVKLTREAEIRAKLSGDVRALVDAASLRPGALFESDALALLTRLRADDPAAWIDARALFKAIPDVPIAKLDRMTAPAGGEGDGKQGREMEWPDPDPCPYPVDGARMLSDIAAFIRRHVWIDEPEADALALWAVMTWIHDRLEVSTFANLTSATKRCGKSLLVEVLGELVRRAMQVSGKVTAAALFRVVEAHAPTLMLDEADTYIREDDVLRGVVNGSQRRALAYIVRCVEPDNEPRKFGTWCPKLIAGIDTIPDTIRDRSLVVRVERKPARERIVPWRERDREAVDAMRGQIARWTRDNAECIVAALPAVVFPDALHDRARDAWESLLAIANAAGGEWAGRDGRAWRACEHFAAASEGDEGGARERLLADLYAIFDADGMPSVLSSTTIVERLHDMEGRPWKEWRRGKPITAHALARLLKPFEIAPRQDRKAGNGANLRGYQRADLEGVWEAYFPHRGGIQSATSLQPLETRNPRDSQTATGKSGVADANVTKPYETRDCSGVALRIPGSGGNGAEVVQLPKQSPGTERAGDAYRRARDGE